VPPLALGVATVFVGTLGIALFAGTLVMDSPQGKDDADATSRCPECGRIESLRDGEFTVRMADGSSRVFREDPAVSWRLGERLIYIDGASAPQ
jgi:hypothetical protein